MAALKRWLKVRGTWPASRLAKARAAFDLGINRPNTAFPENDDVTPPDCPCRLRDPSARPAACAKQGHQALESHHLDHHGFRAVARRQECLGSQPDLERQGQ